MKVSVIILNWNLKDDLLECLESASRIDYAPCDITVLDNGSSDGSARAVRDAFPRVTVVEHSRNRGFCTPYNEAIAKSAGNGGYLLILNNDTVVKPQIINELKAAFDSDRRIGAVTPFIAYYDRPQEMQYRGVRIDWRSAELLGIYAQREFSARKIFDSDIVSWGACMIKTEVFAQCGLLDEDLFMYYDDTDWSVRLRRAGYRAVVLASPLVLHKASRSSGGPYSPLFYFYYTRNKLYFMRKHAPVIRKLQFSRCYLRDCCVKYNELNERNMPEHADSVADGIWSALNGCTQDRRVRMPEEFKQGLRSGSAPALWRMTLKAVFARPGRLLRGEHV